MKSTFSLVICLLSVLVLTGCIDLGPFITKTNLGNLEINIAAPQGLDPQASRIFVDGIFIGNVSSRMPILYLKTGMHRIRVELDGAATYTQEIMVIGDPNHQVLNINLAARQQ